MDVVALHAHCAALPGAWPDNPWDHEHPVFKVGPTERGKIFAFLGATTVHPLAVDSRRGHWANVCAEVRSAGR